MTWYAAHIIEAIELKEGIQDIYPVYENVFLIEAENTDIAFEKATVIGKKESADSELELNGKPAIHVFKGIRKLIEIDNPMEVHIEPSNDPPVHGTEITYSYFEVQSPEDMAKLIEGKEVQVEYIE